MNGFAWNKKVFVRATGDDLEIQQVHALTGKALSQDMQEESTRNMQSLSAVK